MSKTGSAYGDEVSENSQVKSIVVEKYFTTWLSIIEKSSDCVQYVDLFSGRGVYKNGEESTAIKVIKKILDNNVFASKCKVFLNDMDHNNTEDLKNNIEKLEGYKNLLHQPYYFSEIVSLDFVKTMKIDITKPIFLFFDPFGYMGLSLDLLEYFLSKWGSDAIIFFNYNRINAGIENNKVEKYIKDIFSEEGASRLGERLSIIKMSNDIYSKSERVDIVLNTFIEELRKKDLKYSVLLKFYMTDRNRISHFIIGVSKHETGYLKFKEIFSDATTDREENKGFGTFNVHCKDNKYVNIENFHSNSKELLMDDLCEKYSGQEIELERMFKEHHHGTYYYLKSYKSAIEGLEKENKVEVLDKKSGVDGGKRRKNTYPKDIMIKFN